MHWPCASHTSPPSASSATKALTRVVLPIPGSPVSNTVCRAPCRTRPRHWCRCANSRARPTSSGAGDASGVGGRGEGGGGRGGGGRGGGAKRREGANDATPPPMHRLDNPGRRRGLPQRFAQLANAHGQGGLGHHGVRPDRLQQSLFGDQLARLL